MTRLFHSTYFFFIECRLFAIRGFFCLAFLKRYGVFKEFADRTRQDYIFSF